MKCEQIDKKTDLN